MRISDWSADVCSSDLILLIPQGARLIGDYDAEVSAGQTRVLLAWTRLILPDGRSIQLDRQPGADGRGFAGLQDSVNFHWGSLARAALISTVLGVGAELGSGSDDTLVRALRTGTQDSINQAGQAIVRRQSVRASVMEKVYRSGLN